MNKKLCTKEIKKKTIVRNNKKAKDQYFAFYDDVKHFTKGKEDW